MALLLLNFYLHFFIELEKLNNSLDYSEGKYNLLYARYKKLREIAEYYDLKNLEDNEANSEVVINVNRFKKIFVLEKNRESKLNAYINEKENKDKIIKKLKADIETKTKYLNNL